MANADASVPAAATGVVVVLNGPTGSGKTTIARALLRQADQPWLHLGIDALVDGLDPRWLDQAVTWEAERPDVHPLAHGLAATLRSSVAASARIGVNVISDDLFLDESWARGWRDALTGIAALFVRVDADQEDLDGRERIRGDRISRLAGKQLAYIHAHADYQLRLDTSKMSPDECAAAILAALPVMRHT
jgi:chloramphenicol 3-O phosphotransferase